MVRIHIKTFRNWYGTVSTEAEDNFIQFLETQTDSVRNIGFRGTQTVNSTIINKVFEMKATQFIHIHCPVDFTELNMCVNDKILVLGLPSSFDTVDKLVPFLQAAHNLNTLLLSRVNMDILKYIAAQLKHLLILYYSVADCFTTFQNNHEHEGINKVFQVAHKQSNSA